MDAVPAPQALALRGPPPKDRVVNLPVWQRLPPGQTVDCSIVGRRPPAGIRVRTLGMQEDRRISKEHVIFICDTVTGVWTAENLKPNPVYVQKNFATAGAEAETVQLFAHGPPCQLQAGDAICLCVIDVAHRIHIVPQQDATPAASQPPPACGIKREREVDRAATAGQPAEAEDGSPAKRAKKPAPAAVRVPSPDDSAVTPPMAATAAVAAAAAAPRPAAASARRGFGGCRIVFVERGMKERQLTVFQKQVRQGGGQSALLRRPAPPGGGQGALDSIYPEGTTHMVAASWKHAEQAVGIEVLGPAGIPVATADWVVQAIKDSNAGRAVCPVVGKYRLAPQTSAAADDPRGQSDESRAAAEPMRVPYSAGNFPAARYDPATGAQSQSQSHSEPQSLPHEEASAEDEEPEDKVPMLIELFTELKELTEADDTASNGHWRVRNYTKMINALNKYHSNGWPAITRAADYEQILADVRSDRVRGCPLYVIKDCTETNKKVDEALRTGDMERLVAFRADPRMRALKALAA